MKLKFGLNIRINKSVMCANFGDPRSCDRELSLKKHKKKAILGLKYKKKFIKTAIFRLQYNSKTI